jgi:hypothetical protein
VLKRKAEEFLQEIRRKNRRGNRRKSAFLYSCLSCPPVKLSFKNFYFALHVLATCHRSRVTRHVWKRKAEEFYRR